MKNRTKLLTLALVAALLLTSVVACGSKKEAVTPEADRIKRIKYLIFSCFFKIQ